MIEPPGILFPFATRFFRRRGLLSFATVAKRAGPESQRRRARRTCSRHPDNLREKFCLRGCSLGERRCDTVRHEQRKSPILKWLVMVERIDNPWVARNALLISIKRC